MIRRWIVGILFMLVVILESVPVFAGEAQNQIMENRNQDMLFVGKVTHVSRDYIVLKVTDYVNVKLDDSSIEKRESDHRYVISKDKAISYKWSYHKRESVKEGDCIVASLKKKNQKWEISNGLFEVSSDDYQTLSFEPFQQKPDFSKMSLKYFVNSDGEMKDFSANSSKTKFYWKKKKIFDARWNLKKYLTVEEIRNAEKLKAMDQRAHVTETRATPKSTAEVKKRILFVVDILLIVGLVTFLRKKSQKNKGAGIV